MGIANFNKFIKSKYPGIIGPWLRSCSVMYIDVNFVLHGCITDVRNEQQLADKAQRYIETLVRICPPTQQLILAADGVPPLAKLMLQRKRRAQVTDFDGSDSAYVIDEDFGIKVKKTVDAVMLTCNSPLMNSLPGLMNKFYLRLAAEHSIAVTILDNQYDEAELKLKRCLQENVQEYPDQSHVYVSTDCDVVSMLLTVASSSNCGIYVSHGLRDVVASKATNNEQRLNLLSVTKLAASHAIMHAASQYSCLDFTFLTIFMGNDYLPKLMYVTFDKLWDAYRETVEYLKCGIVTVTSDGDPVINSDFLELMLQILLPKIVKRKTDLRALAPEMYATYWNGVDWVFKMYYYGLCDDYTYIYDSQTKPWVIGALMHINLWQELSPRNKNSPICPEVYYKCVMPRGYLPKHSLEVEQILKRLGNKGLSREEIIAIMEEVGSAGAK